VGEPLKLKERIADMHRAVAELLPAKTFPREQLDAHWAMLDQEYFTRHEADNIAWHARNILPARALDLPIVATRMAHETKTLEVLFFAPDRDGLFGDIAGAFDRLNLSILEVRMHLTRAGFAIDVFTVLPPADASKSFVSDLSVELRSQLLRPGPPRRDLRHHLPRRLKHFPVRPGVSFSEAVNGATTAVEVTAQDRPGLLHQIALALNECRVRLTTAKIATYGERAEDIFFVTNRDGQPLGETDQECLRREISRRLDQGTGTAEEPQARAIPI
jgi:[protein-PII] uridylyltransferase